MTCSWYNIPADANGDPDPTATPTPRATVAPDIKPPTPVAGGPKPVTRLPKTGSGATDTTVTGLVAISLLALALATAGLLTRRQRS